MSHQPTGPEARRGTRSFAGFRPWIQAASALAASIAIPVAVPADPAPKRDAFAPAADRREPEMRARVDRQIAVLDRSAEDHA